MADFLPSARRAVLPAARAFDPRRWRGMRPTLEIRRALPPARQAAIVGGAVLLGLAISALILVIAGVPAGDLADEFIAETLFDPTSLRAVLAQSAPLILVGLAAAVAFRASFWNLGLEGQMIWGGIAATAVSLFGIGPAGGRLELMAVAAILAGMAWAAIGFYLKDRFQVSEIISTLLMNYVALYLLLDLLYGAWQDPKDSFPHSPLYAAAERLPNGGGLGLALLAAAAASWLVLKSRFGLYTRFVQASRGVALGVGVPVRRVTLAAVLVSGGLAALGGFVIANVQEGRLTQSFFDGYGFSGILIAFLARNNPLAATVVAFLVAVLFVAGQSLQVFYQIPFAMVQLIEAVIVIAVAASEFLIRHRVRWTR